LKTGVPAQDEIEAAEAIKNFQHKPDKEMEAMGSDDEEGPKKKSS
jgi:hypothetical protein